MDHNAVAGRPDTISRSGRTAIGVACAVVALTLAACGGTSASGNSGGSGPITVADLAPFTGPDAALGPTYLASCFGATQAINNAGGVLGHTMTCKSVDTRGDPADAVPATRQMFASTSNLALVIGVTSDEAASVVPIINANKT
ncbi:MAG TPA: ABC transporter substrate-binding protein, partial [Pseudonocardiaceae bacterium]